jgi:hypothetical protein
MQAAFLRRTLRRIAIIAALSLAACGDHAVSLRVAHVNRFHRPLAVAPVPRSA